MGMASTQPSDSASSDSSRMNSAASAWEAAIPSTSNNHTKTSTRKEPASGAKARRCEAIAGAAIIKETKSNFIFFILTF